MSYTLPELVFRLEIQGIFTKKNEETLPVTKIGKHKK